MCDRSTRCWIRLVCWVGLSLQGGLAQAADPAADPIDLPTALDLAERHHPDLPVAQAELTAAQAQVGAARAWLVDNPELESGLGRRFAPAEDGFDADLALSQRFELGGQRAARQAVARQGLARSRARRDNLFRELRAQVTQAFVAGLLARRELGFARDGLALAEQLQQAAHDRVAAGAASELELNLAGIEAARARRAVHLAQLEQRRADLTLGRLIGRETGQPIELAGSLEPAPVVSLASERDLVELALSRRADLQARDRRVAQRQAELELADAQAWPGLTVRLAYSLEASDEHIASAGLGIELPIFERNQAARAEATGLLARAEADRSRALGEVRLQVALALEDVRAADGLVQAFGRDVLAQLDRNLELLHEAFRAGKVGLLEVLLVQKDLVQAHREFAHSLAQLHRARAELERVLGGPIP